MRRLDDEFTRSPLQHHLDEQNPRREGRPLLPSGGRRGSGRRRGDPVERHRPTNLRTPSTGPFSTPFPGASPRRPRPRPTSPGPGG
jgi:hypothetical protein